jgi:hypothetical protein
VTGCEPTFVTVSVTPPGPAVEVTRKISVGGLKNVIRLDVNDAAETVTLFDASDRPGTPNGPRLMHVPSAATLQSASVAHVFWRTQLVPRTR